MVEPDKPIPAEPVFTESARPISQANPLFRDRPLDFKQRMWALATGIVLFGLLLLARFLSPNPDGIGTHQQLGLPPCTFVGMFGVRCPTCGMTTSWAHFTRLQFASSWQANPGGLCLAIVALCAGTHAITSAVRGRYRSPLNAKWSVALTLAITALTLFDWASRL